MYHNLTEPELQKRLYCWVKILTIASLDIKKLQGEPYFRLRVGQWRIIFDRDNEVKIISIEKIKPRGDAYK